jgi:hypothetical protein
LYSDPGILGLLLLKMAYPGATEHPPCGFMLGARPGAESPDHRGRQRSARRELWPKFSRYVDQSRVDIPFEHVAPRQILPRNKFCTSNFLACILQLKMPKIYSQ